MNSYGSVSLVSGVIYKLLRHLNWFSDPVPDPVPGPVPDHADQINELSDDLLYNYKRKARKAINKLNSPPPSNPDSPRAKQLENRVKGFRLAWDKLGRK